MEPTRILIADDHPHFREGLRALLLSTPEVEVLGEACDGEETVTLAARLQPDVILMDLNMPGTGGIEATRRILRTSPHIAILVVSMYEDDDSVFAALQAGARGYLLKGALKAEIMRSIRPSLAGRRSSVPSSPAASCNTSRIPVRVLHLTPSPSSPSVSTRSWGS